MTIDIIDEIKARLKLEDEIAKSFTLTGKGRSLSTKEHDALKVRSDWQHWRWYSTAWRSFGSGDRDHGDIFDWYQLAHRCDFRTALEDLARMAGVELRPLTVDEQKVHLLQRGQEAVLEMAARYYQALLWLPVGSEGLAYCRGRGWTDATIEREMLGYVPRSQDSASLGNKALSHEGASHGGASHEGASDETLVPLHRQLSLAGLGEHPAAQAVLSIPMGHIVYVHRQRGKVVYLSGRSIETKRHYNLPETLVGAKQTYQNDPELVTRRGVRLLVEGQADAVSLSQYGLQAVALCGVDTNAALGTISHVALDNDETGREKTLGVALGVDPLVCVVTWPDQLPSAVSGGGMVAVKDANDLLKSNLSNGQLAKLLEDAPVALVELAKLAGKCREREDRQSLIDRFCALYTGLDEMVQADMMGELAKHLCGGKMSQFRRLIKTYEENADRKQKDEDEEYSEQHVITPGGFVGGYLFEQCVQKLPTGEFSTYYWVRTPEGKFEKRPSVKVGAICYFPVDPREEELIRGGDVQFASDRAESGTEVELLRDIRKFIHKWLDVPAYYENIASYYVLLSWFYDAGYKTLPYLRALGDYGSGKSRFIHTIGQLCFRPMLFGGGDSEATIYYTLELFRGTMVIDESDFKSSDESALISKIINLGNNEHGAIKRLDPKPNGQGYRVKRYSVFGPKVFGARESFTDQASDSRCLTHYTTKGTLRPDVPLELTDEFDENLLHLRNRLLDFRLKNWQVVKIDPSEMDRSVMPRLAQITLALKSIIKDERMLNELQRFVQIYNQSLVSDRQMTDPAIVVEALVRIRYPRPTLMPVPPEWTITNIAEIAQAIQMDFDPEQKFSPKKTGHVLSKQLGLIRRNGRDGQGRIMILVDDEELGGLMNRYGISKPEWVKDGDF